MGPGENSEEDDFDKVEKSYEVAENIVGCRSSAIKQLKPSELNDKLHYVLSHNMSGGVPVVYDRATQQIEASVLSAEDKSTLVEEPKEGGNISEEDELDSEEEKEYAVARNESSANEESPTKVCKFSIYKDAQDKTSVVFNTATDNGIRKESSTDTSQKVLGLETVFKCLKSEDFKKKVENCGFPMHVLIPLASDWKSSWFSSHAHFRLLDLTINKDGDSIQVSRANLIDSRSRICATNIGTPEEKIRTEITSEFPGCTFGSVYTGHQELTNTTTCGYYAADYAAQIASGTSELRDRLGLQEGRLGWLCRGNKQGVPYKSITSEDQGPTMSCRS